MKKEYKVSAVISRTEGSNTSYRLQISDDASHAVLELMMDSDQFARMLTSAIQSDIPATGLNIEHFGKTKVIENRSLVFTRSSNMLYADLKEQARGLILDTHLYDKEWTPSTYLGSRDSIEYGPGDFVRVNYTVHKFV